MTWFIMTLLMIATVLTICWPLVRRRTSVSGHSGEIYVAQLSEINREEAAGLTSIEDARMARLEIERRLIGTTQVEPAAVENALNLTDRTTFIAIAAVVVIGASVLYAVVGSPDVPASPSMASIRGNESRSATEASVGSVDEMIAKLEARLESAPEDVEGWRMLGWSKFRTADYNGAAAAYAQAIKLAPNDAETSSAYGGALTRVAGGQVTQEAAAALQVALGMEPTDARARFLLGLRKDQAGKPGEALDDWLAMLTSAPADAPWFDEVRSRAVELSGSSGIDITSRLPPARTAVSAPTVTPSGPTQQDFAQASELSPEDRQTMIDGMVARLDQRLKQDPNDLEGWLKLIRARRVLGQEDLASRALADGQAAFSGDSASLARLKAAFVESLALPPN
jgi:cytochrome c-type biogenesis protein CcmH